MSSPRLSDMHTIGWVREQRARHVRDNDLLAHRLIARLYEKVGQLEQEVRALRLEVEDRRDH